MEFLSLAHVYGGPVSSALIEELAYYGIEYALAYGLAGGLGTKNLKMGDFYIVEQALAMDGTTPHYTDDRLIPSDRSLNARIEELAEKAGLPEMKRCASHDRRRHLSGSMTRTWTMPGRTVVIS